MTVHIIVLACCALVATIYLFSLWAGRNSFRQSTGDPVDNAAGKPPSIDAYRRDLRAAGLDQDFDRRMSYEQAASPARTPQGGCVRTGSDNLAQPVDPDLGRHVCQHHTLRVTRRKDA